MNKPFDWCLKLFILLAPTIYCSTIEQRALQMLFFLFSTIVMFCVAMVSTPMRKSLNIWVALFLLWNVVQVLIINLAQFPLAFFNVVIGCLLYYLIVMYASNIRGICKWFMYVMFLNIPLLISQIFKYNLIFTPAIGAIYEQTLFGFFSFSNHLALYMAIIAPIVLYFSWWLLPVAIFMTFIPRCLTADIVMTLSVFTLACFHLKRFKVYVLFVSVLLFVIFTFFSNVMGKVLLKSTPEFTAKTVYAKVEMRLKIWEATIKEATVNPYWGRGLVSFNTTSYAFTKDICEKRWDTPQNDYVHLMYEIGFWATLILISGYIVSIFRRIKEVHYDKLALALFISIISILISMIPQYFLYVPRLITAVVVILALFEARVYDLKKGDVACI